MCVFRMFIQMAFVFFEFTILLKLVRDADGYKLTKLCFILKMDSIKALRNK